uniref:Uncharacterized protein n=1 Tax=Anopheles atroparvus TaxID=41427 RepID=A0A182IMM2_ANOAO
MSKLILRNEIDIEKGNIFTIRRHQKWCFVVEELKDDDPGSSKRVCLLESQIQCAKQYVEHVRHPDVGGEAGVEDEPALQPGAERQYPEGPLLEDAVRDVPGHHRAGRPEQREQRLRPAVEQRALLLVDLVPQQLHVHLHLNKAGHRQRPPEAPLDDRNLAVGGDQVAPQQPHRSLGGKADHLLGGGLTGVGVLCRHHFRIRSLPDRFGGALGAFG